MKTWRVLALFVSAAAGLPACQPGQDAASRARAVPAATRARSGVAPVPTPAGDVEFRAVLDLNQTPAPDEPALRGGREAVSAEWPASLYATFSAGGATAACTAALIGPAVMLTAAHCVPTAGAVTFVYGGHDRPYAAACTRHPDYVAPPGDASADFALCLVTPAFEAPEGFEYETVSTSNLASLISRTVLLTGFGCVSSVAASAPFDSKYRIAVSTIDESSASLSRSHGDGFYAPKEANNLFTNADSGRNNLCAGDSGGPVFAQTWDGPDMAGRVIVGITSRVFLDAEGTGFGASIVSATGGPSFHAWALQWTREAGAAACGITGQAANCRS